MNFFERIHINSFKGMKSVYIDSPKKINIIISYGNFGKTSFLEALGIMLQPESIARSYNYFLKNYRNNYFVAYEEFFSKDKKIELSWNFGGLEFFDRLIGEFETNGFSGYHYSQIENENLNIKKINSGVAVISANQKAFFEEKALFDVKLQKLDFLKVRRYNTVQGLADKFYKQYILDFIKCFNEDVIDIITDTQKGIFIKLKNGKRHFSGYLGDFLCNSAYMENAIGYAKDGIVIIDDVDAMVTNKNAEAFANMFLASVYKSNCQIFVTMRESLMLDAMLKILKRSGRLQTLSVTVLYKNENDGTFSSVNYSGGQAYKIRFEERIDLRSKY